MDKKIRKVIYLLLVLFCISGISCSLFDELDEQNYQSQYDKGGTFVSESNYEKAEQSYLSALSIAEKHKWTGRTVSAKQRLAEIYLATNKYDQTKKQLLEAKTVCINSSDCPAGLLGSIYDYLVQLSLFKENNIALSGQYIDEVISLQQRLEKDKSIKNRLYSYAEDMRVSGFEKQADDLIIRANHLSN